MTRTFGRIAIALLLAAPQLLAADVKNDWDKTYDFSQMKTFAVKIGTGWGNELGEARAVKDIGEALTERGWKAAPEASADALVVIHGATEKKRSLNTFYDGWGGYGYYGGFGGYTSGGSTTTVSEWVVGTLVVDIFDAKTKKVIFRGTATDELSKDPKKTEKKMNKAATKMFKDFPPAAAKR